MGALPVTRKDPVGSEKIGLRETTASSVLFYLLSPLEKWSAKLNHRFLITHAPRGISCVDLTDRINSIRGIEEAQLSQTSWLAVTWQENNCTTGKSLRHFSEKKHAVTWHTASLIAATECHSNIQKRGRKDPKGSSIMRHMKRDYVYKPFKQSSRLVTSVRRRDSSNTLPGLRLLIVGPVHLFRGTVSVSLTKRKYSFVILEFGEGGEICLCAKRIEDERATGGNYTFRPFESKDVNLHHVCVSFEARCPPGRSDEKKLWHELSLAVMSSGTADFVKPPWSTLRLETKLLMYWKRWRT